MKEAQETVDDIFKSGAKALIVSEAGIPIAHELYIWNATDAWKRKERLCWLGMTLTSAYFLFLMMAFL
jgi:hypothetical protein